MQREGRTLTSLPTIDSSVVSLCCSVGEFGPDPWDIISSSSWYTGSLSVTFSMCFLSEVMDFRINKRTINLMRKQ